MPFFQLSKHEYSFPPPYFADTEGLIAVGGDLSPERVFQAYKQGIYFWFGPMDPIKWWSPDPRIVLYPAEFTTHSFQDKYKPQKIHHLKDFEKLLRLLQDQENQGTMGPSWITEEMITTYLSLFNSGQIGSWQIIGNEQITGGTFGIQLGQFIFLEYFLNHFTENATHTNDQIMIAFLESMKEENINIVDIQKETIRINDIGIHEISRLDYLAQIKKATAENLMNKEKNHI